jgi:hypothetical protein
MLKNEIFIKSLNIIDLNIAISNSSPKNLENEIGNLLINNYKNELNNLRVQLELILIKQK